MKKILFLLALAFSLSSVKAQDTSYFTRRGLLYSEIRQVTQVKDSLLIKKYLWVKTPKQKRRDRIFSIGTGVIFSIISIWYWSGGSK